jgi:hypothetical protein
VGSDRNRPEGAYNEDVTSDRDERDARAAAIGDLFAALEDLMIRYGTLPEDERPARWSADAERITGEIARHLHGARHRIAAAGPVFASHS